MKKIAIFSTILFVGIISIFLVLSCSTLKTEESQALISIQSGTQDIVNLASYLRTPSYDADFQSKMTDLIVNKKFKFFIIWDSWNGIEKASIIKQIASANNTNVIVLMYLDFQGLKANSNTGNGTTEALYGENYSGVNKKWFLQQTTTAKYYYWWDGSAYKYAATDPNTINGWPQEFLTKGMQRAINGKNFDGLFGDDLWPNILNRSPVAKPKNYSSDAKWQQIVKAALTKMGSMKSSQFPSKMLFFNMGGSHDQFTGLWQNWISVPGINGFLEEWFAMDTDRNLWYMDVKELEDTYSLGKVEIANWWAQSKKYSSGTEVEKDKQVMFAFSSYLLGANANSYFSFNGSEKDPLYYSIVKAELGMPLGNFEVPEKEIWSTLVYPKYAIRRFENGMVIVNPKWPPRQGMSYRNEIISPNSPNSKTVVLNGNYNVLDENGLAIKTVSGQVIVPDYTGMILKKISQ